MSNIYRQVVGTDSTRFDEPLCPNCLTVNGLSTHFCTRCATPLTAYAELDPLGRIRCEMDGYRKAIAHPRGVIVLIGMWMLMGPSVFSCLFVIGFGVVLLIGEPFHFNGNALAAMAGFLFACAILAIFGSILFRTTRNYFRVRDKADGEMTDTDHAT